MANPRYLLFMLLFFTGLTTCAAQETSTSQTFNSKIFGWSIEVPQGFERLSPEECARLKSKGAAAIEDTYGEKVEDLTTTLFMFRKGAFNYMEATHQPFEGVDGTYDEQRKGLQEILYGTFVTQMRDAKIDTVSYIQTVSKLDFYVFETRIVFPNNMMMKMFMYSRLFDKKEFVVNIVYVEPKEGEFMMEAWKNSKFEQNQKR